MPIEFQNDQNVTLQKLDTFEFVFCRTNAGRSQHIDEVTHDRGGHIDLIIASSDCIVSSITVTEQVDLPDQFLPICRLPLKQPETESIPVEEESGRIFTLIVSRPI